MRDRIEAGLWADRHQHLATAFDRLFADVRIVFERIAARNFAAPWRERRLEIPPRCS